LVVEINLNSPDERSKGLSIHFKITFIQFLKRIQLKKHFIIKAITNESMVHNLINNPK
jgi:hypothetical protein